MPTSKLFKLSTPDDEGVKKMYGRQINRTWSILNLIFKFDFAFVAVSPRNTLNVNQNLTKGKKMNEKNPLEGLAIGVKPLHILTGIKGHYLELEVRQGPIICVGVYVKNKRVSFLPRTKIEVVNQTLDLYQNDNKVANLEGINVKMKEEIESYLSFCFEIYEILVSEDDEND